MEIKIKNKYSKSKINKSNIKLNKFIKCKKLLREKTKSIKPYNSTEKFLYESNLNEIENKVRYIKPNDKYIYLNNIFLLNTIAKKDCTNLYNGILNLYNDNLLENDINYNIKKNDFKKAILSFENNNYDRFLKLCSLSPKKKS